MANSYPNIAAVTVEVHGSHKAFDSLTETNSLKRWTFAHVVEVHSSILCTNGHILTTGAKSEAQKF